MNSRVCALSAAAVLAGSGLACGQIIFTPVHVMLPPPGVAQGQYSYDFDVTRNGVDDLRMMWVGESEVGPFSLTIEALHPGAGVGAIDLQTVTPQRLSPGSVIGPALAYPPGGIAYRDFGPMLPAFTGNWLPGESGYFALRIMGPTEHPHYGWAKAHVTPYPCPRFVLTGFAYQSDPATPIDAGEFCYADCDGSAAVNIDDFLCFINQFAEAQSLPPSEQVHHYANCDGSTTHPVLTIDDFVCFINAFAQGCP